MSGTIGGIVSGGLDMGLNMVSGGAWGKATGGGFSGFRVAAPRIMQAATRAKPPELDAKAQADRDEEVRKERERRLLGGRASTILTGGLGDTSTPQLGSSILLGS